MKASVHTPATTTSSFSDSFATLRAGNPQRRSREVRLTASGRHTDDSPIVVFEHRDFKREERTGNLGLRHWMEFKAAPALWKQSEMIVFAGDIEHLP